MENGKKRTGAAAGFDMVTGKIRRFISETMAELGRCTWPNRQQLFESTVLVVVNIAILACFVAAVDWVAAWGDPRDHGRKVLGREQDERFS